MKRVIAVLLSCAVAAGAGAGAYYQLIYKGKIGDGRVSSASEDAVYVDPVAVIAGIGTGSGQIERYAGVVEPQDTWEVKLDGDTKIEKTYVKVGDEVKQGDPLFKYDTTESEQKIAQDEIDVERDKNNIETDTKTIEEYRKQLARATTEADRLELETQILQKQNDIKTTEYDIQTIPSENGFVIGGRKYKKGSSVFLAALPNEGFLFSGWYENGTLISKEATLQFYAKENRTLSAKFEKINTDELH